MLDTFCRLTVKVCVCVCLLRGVFAGRSWKSYMSRTRPGQSPPCMLRSLAHSEHPVNVSSLGPRQLDQSRETLLPLRLRPLVKMETRLEREDEAGRLEACPGQGLVTSPKESLGPGERGQRAEWGDNRKDFLTGRGRRPGQGKLLPGKEVSALTSEGSPVHTLGQKSQGSAWEDRKGQVTG